MNRKARKWHHHRFSVGRETVSNKGKAVSASHAAQQLFFHYVVNSVMCFTVIHSSYTYTCGMAYYSRPSPNGTENKGACSLQGDDVDYRSIANCSHFKEKIGKLKHYCQRLSLH